MAQLPRAQQKTIYKPAAMPNLAGSGWTAPGKATQQLGESIGKLGNAFDVLAQKQEEEDLFRTRLALVEFTNKMEADNIDAEKGFTPDMDASTWSNDRTTHYRDSATDLISRLPQTPKSQRMARLYIAQHGGAYQRRAMAFESTQRTANLINQSEATITGDLSRVDLSDPKTAIANLETSLQGAEGIINAIPGASPAQRRYLMQHAATLAQSKLEALPPEIKATAAQTIIDQWREKLSVASPPAAEGGDGPDYRGRGGPAAIRYNNPGAMYPGPSSRKFGATHTEIIGGGHKIAVFPDAVSGAAAQFDLLASRKYTGMTLTSAIRKWSGGNSSDAYTAKVAAETGLTPGTVLTPDMIKDPRIAIPIAKAMASMESGKSAYPLSDGQWAAAHARAFGDSAPAATASGNDYELGPDPEIGPSRAPVRLQSGARAQLLENLSRRMPVYRAQQLAAVDKMVKRAESVAKDGKELPDAEMATIAEAVNATGSPVLAYRLKLAGYEAEVVRERKMDSPAVALARAQAERAAIEASGKTTPENLARVKAQETLARTIQEQVKKDYIAWAQKTGAIPAQPTLTADSSENDFRNRIEVARALAAKYGTTLQVFTEAEQQQIGEFLKTGGKNSLGFLRTMYEVAGKDTPAVMREIAKGAPEYAHLGWLISRNVNSKTINDLGEALALVKSEKFKGITIRDTDRRAWANSIVETGFGQQKQAYERAMRIADILYQKRALDQGVINGSNAELWKRAFRDVIGENTGVDGKDVYGGVEYRGGYLWGGAAVLLPPTIRNGALDDVMGAIRLSDLVKQPETGEPVVAPPIDAGKTLPDVLTPGWARPATDAVGITGGGKPAPQPLGVRDGGEGSLPPMAPADQQRLAVTSQGVKMLTGQDPQQINYGLPVDENGRPVTIQMIRGAKLEVIGDGTYWLKTDENPTRYIKNPDGTNYILNLNELEPVLRGRVPDAFRPGGETSTGTSMAPIIRTEVPMPDVKQVAPKPEPAPAPARLPGSQWTVPEPKPARRPKTPPAADAGPSNRLPAAPQ